MNGYHLRKSLRLWPLALFVLLPLTTMLLFVTHPGRTTLHQIFERAPRGAMLPGLTVEVAVPPAHGLIVTSLRSDSPAATHGIAVGDNIEAIDGRPATSLAKASDYLRADHRGMIVLELMHNQHLRRIDLPRNGGGTHGA